MNGMHDLGGMHGFGPVIQESDEPPFHEAWEGRVLALMRSLLYTRAWNIDMFRDSAERVPPVDYLSISYYHRWLVSLSQSAVEKGLVSPAELAAGRSMQPRRPVERTMGMAEVGAAYIRPPCARPAQSNARFKTGDKVRTINENPVGHTRLPRYARDKVGVIEAVHGCHVYPDSMVAGKGEDPQWLYTVAIRGQDLWGDHSDPTLTVSVEAFEPYLRAA